MLSGVKIIAASGLASFCHDTPRGTYASRHRLGHPTHVPSSPNAASSASKSSQRAAPPSGRCGRRGAGRRPAGTELDPLRIGPCCQARARPCARRPRPPRLGPRPVRPFSHRHPVQARASARTPVGHRPRRAGPAPSSRRGRRTAGAARPGPAAVHVRLPLTPPGQQTRTPRTGSRRHRQRRHGEPAGPLVGVT
jgi:hypothetical protein